MSAARIHWPLTILVCATPAIYALRNWNLLFLVTYICFNGWMLYQFRHSDWRSDLGRRPILLLYAIAILWALASTIWAPDFNDAIRTGVFLLLVSSPLLYMAMMPEDEAMRTLSVCGAGIVVMIILIYIMYLLNYGSIRYGKLPSALMSPAFGNRAPAYYASLVPLMYWLTLINPRIALRRLGFFCLVSGLMIPGLSGSRGGVLACLLAYIIATGIFLITPALRARFSRAALLTLALGTGVAILSSFVDPTPKSMGNSIERLQRSDLVQEIFPDLHNLPDATSFPIRKNGRQIMYFEGWKLVRSPSWFGEGLDAVFHYTGEIWGKKVRAHNLIITAVGELGIIGGLLMVSFIILITFITVQIFQSIRDPARQSLLLACYGGLMVSFFSAMFRANFDTPVVPLLIGMICTMHAQARYPTGPGITSGKA